MQLNKFKIFVIILIVLVLAAFLFFLFKYKIMEEKTLTENEKVFYKDENIEFSYPKKWKEFERAKWESFSTVMSVSLPQSTQSEPLTFSLLVYKETINKDDFEKTVKDILDRVNAKYAEKSIVDITFSLEEISSSTAIIRAAIKDSPLFIGEGHFFLTSQGKIYNFEFVGLNRLKSEKNVINIAWQPYFEEIIKSIKIY